MPKPGSGPSKACLCSAGLLGKGEVDRLDQGAGPGHEGWMDPSDPEYRYCEVSRCHSHHRRDHVRRTGHRHLGGWSRGNGEDM